MAKSKLFLMNENKREAGPDLYAALEAVVAAYDKEDWPFPPKLLRDAIEKARATLLKARGE